MLSLSFQFVFCFYKNNTNFIYFISFEMNCKFTGFNDYFEDKKLCTFAYYVHRSSKCFQFKMLYFKNFIFSMFTILL